MWKPLYGSFEEEGVSVEWHDFSIEVPLQWSQSFHKNSLEICLNYTGEAEFFNGNKIYRLGNEQVALYTTAGGHLTEATRKPDTRHRFLTLEFSVDYLCRHFGECQSTLIPGVRRFMEDPNLVDRWMEIIPMPSAILSIRPAMIDPPVPSNATRTWYQSKILEVLAQMIFQKDSPEELFCHRYKRTKRERIERVQYLLERDIENPPTLEMLAQEVGCSTFYLSRLFAEETGVSLPKYLRLKRVEKAAELIAEEGMSVTEAAMAVGYSSLSAFHKAFVDHHGVAPSQFGMKKKSDSANTAE